MRAPILALLFAYLTVLDFIGASKPVRNVAIIGAGAAGSSTAYHLHKYAQDDAPDTAVNITIFEKTDRIGGRTLTVNPHGQAQESVELGASIFIQINAILYNATQEFGLETTSFSDAGGVMSIWDGDKFVLEIDQTLPTWRVVLKILWKYGIRGPVNANNLMKATIAKFLKLYEKPFFPFKSLSERAFDLDLLEATGVTGKEYLEKNNVAERYAHDVVQASTRVNYASNLAYIHGLDTMVSIAPEGAMSVRGGNWQIFDHMVSKAGASVLLNTSITSITLGPGKESASTGQKYVLKSRSPEAAEVSYPILFDDVVIATPYQFSDIKTSSDVIHPAIDEIPYVKLHVTLFSSPFRFNPAFFNLPPGTAVPRTVLTTLADGEDPSSGNQGAGKAGFYSVSTLRNVINPKTKKQEYVYKIFSPEEVTPEFLSSLLGVAVPETFTGGEVPGWTGESSAVEPISWYYPHVFHSYPKAYPRVTFQDPVIRDGLYYTSGMESFISTMETNALMGMNVARLIIDSILGLSTGGTVDAGSAEGYNLGQTESQRPLAAQHQENQEL